MGHGRAMVTKVNRRPFADMCCWPSCEVDTGPVDAPLCMTHLAVAYRIYSEAVHEPLDAVFDHSVGKALLRVGRTPAPPKLKAEGLVYFIRFGGLVKIGWTARLAQRMQEVPNEEILGTVAGTMEDEKRCHVAFSHLRVKGEWFRPEPDLLAFIADVTSRSQG